MNKYLVLTCKDKEDGTKEYTENYFFADTSKDVKELEGFRSIVSTEYVSHPSPEVMQRALIHLGMNLVDFYTTCEATAKALEESERQLCEAGDEAALKRRERRIEQEQERVKRAAERDAKKAKEKAERDAKKAKEKAELEDKKAKEKTKK